MKKDPAVRFWARVDKHPSGCWLWSGSVTTNGYGQFWSGTRTMGAHKWLYEQTNGPVPIGQQLDHRCRVRHCVNPDHLEPVDATTNVRRSPTHNANKTHCPQGHAYSQENVISYKGRRLCRTCNRVRSLARYHARKK